MNKMSRLSMVYNGKAADEMNKEELIKAILVDSGVVCNGGDFGVWSDSIMRAMNEAHRCGFLSGEEYAYSMVEPKG
jgi:hypothetical protein